MASPVASAEMAGEMESFELTSMIRGFHIYKEIWDPSLDDCLVCAQDCSNRYDPFAVAVLNGRETVGHVPKKISAPCFLFLRRGGTIHCQVIGSRRYSEDLPQGGMEVPCVYCFYGLKGDVNKLKKLLDQKPDQPPASKKIKLEKKVIVVDCTSVLVHGKNSVETTNSKWLKIDSTWLEIVDKQILLEGGCLNDRHMNYAQAILTLQFPSLNGLHSTLKVTLLSDSSNAIQIVHCKERHHWLTASTIGCEPGKVKIYDSFFTSLDEGSSKAVKGYFGGLSLEIAEDCPRQNNAADCGVFAIMFATILAHGTIPKVSEFSYNTAAFRSHVLQCFIEKRLYPVLMN